MRVRDQRIRARYNELSRSSTAPLLKGRLVRESSGTRIVARIQWTIVIAAPFTLVLMTLLLLGIVGSAITEGEQLMGAFSLLGAITFGVLSVLGFHNEPIQRRYEEARLRDELLATFSADSHH